MEENINEAIVVMIVGLGGVFTSLVFFYLLMLALNGIESRINKSRASRKLSPKPAANSEEQINISPEIVAVISAAAYETFRKPVVVKKVKYLKQTDSKWSETGRMIVMGSHNINKSN